MRLMSKLIKLKSKLSKSCNRCVSFFSSSTLLSCFCFLNTNKEQRMNQIRPRSSSSSMIDDTTLLQTRDMFPLAMMQRKKRARKNQRDMSKEDVVEEACRSFENYLIHVIIVEGKIDDLTDIEELLYYWNKLNSPIFTDLVTTFYGEICTDLFSRDDDD